VKEILSYRKEFFDGKDNKNHLQNI